MTTITIRRSRILGRLQAAAVMLLSAGLMACGNAEPTMTSPDDEAPRGSTAAAMDEPSYQQPTPDTTAPPAVPSAPASEPTVSTSPADPGRLTVLGPIALELPDGWRVDNTPRPLRLSTLRPEGEGAQVEIILTVMAGSGPLDLANINRWRQQVGMGPVANVDGEQIEPINAELSGYAYTLLADSDQAPGSLVAALQLTADRRVYLRMAGLSGQIREHADAFHAVVHSVRPQ